QLGAPLAPSEVVGRDHTGQSLTLLELRDPELAIEPWGVLDDRSLLTVELPAVFERLGIGGVLSPQGLAEGDRVVVVELLRRSLALAPRGAALAELASRGVPLGHAPDAICRERGDPDRVTFV